MKPTLRDNYRYVVVRIISKKQVTKDSFEQIIQKELPPIIGQLHYSGVMPKVAFFDGFKQAAIIRCLHTGSDLLKSSLSLISSHNSEKIHLMPFYTSGTIRKAKEVMKKSE